MTEITRDAIVAAYRQTEILPVARTWDTRATLPDGRSVARGCALVALCRAAGIDPEPIIVSTGAYHYDLVNALAPKLGVPYDVARAAYCGWDRWPQAPQLIFHSTDAAQAAYLAAREAAAAVLGPRYERAIADEGPG